MNTKTILLVDDEPKILILLKDFLELEGYRILTAPGGSGALSQFREHPDTDLIILDVMMPDIDGWTVCREIRKTSDVPIIMLTARSEDYDEIHGFEIGADDYVTKPVRPGALMARIRAMFRRQEKSEHQVCEAGAIAIDRESHIVTAAGAEISLSPKEYTLLLMLMDHKGKVVSREQLLNEVWGYDYYGGLRTVDTHVNRLRLKLGDSSTNISTVRGFGYRFEVMA